MKLIYEIFILTSLIFYSTLSISLLGPWMYRKAKSLMPHVDRRLPTGSAWQRQWQGRIRKEEGVLLPRAAPLKIFDPGITPSPILSRDQCGPHSLLMKHPGGGKRCQDPFWLRHRAA